MPDIRRRCAAAARRSRTCAATVGLPLAIVDRPYEATTLLLEPGDCIVLYTDGVTEVRSPAGELYGEARLQAVVHAAPADVTALGEAILADVRKFADGRPMADDLTLVCFGRTA